MSDAPGWVSYLALGVSGIAAVISYLSYSTSNPRIRLYATLSESDSVTRRVTVLFTVVNSGRGDTSIVGFHMTPRKELTPVVTVASDYLEEGPELPHRLAGNSQVTWKANILPAAREYGEGLGRGLFAADPKLPSHMFLTVKTGSNKFVHDKSLELDVYKLVAGVFPVD